MVPLGTLPGTLDVVVFVVEGCRYALDVGTVEQVLPMVEISPLPHAPPVALGVINLHGRIVPVVDIRRRSSLPQHDYGVDSRLLVARTSRRTLALPVDEVAGVWAIAAETVAPPDAVLPGIGQVAGIAARPDGVVFIHDPDALLSLDEERRLTEAFDKLKG